MNGTTSNYTNNDNDCNLRPLKIRVTNLHCYHCSRTFLTKDAFKFHVHGDEMSNSSDGSDESDESESSSESSDEEEELSDIGFESESDFGVDSDVEDFAQSMMSTDFWTIDMADPGMSEMDTFQLIETPAIPTINMSQNQIQIQNKKPEKTTSKSKSKKESASKTKTKTKPKSKKETPKKTKVKSPKEPKSKRPSKPRRKRGSLPRLKPGPKPKPKPPPKPKSKPGRKPKPKPPPPPKIEKQEIKPKIDPDDGSVIPSIFICTICNKKQFKSLKTQKKHMKLFHDPVLKTKYMCPEPGCDKGYATRPYLREHVNRTHLKVRDVTCPYEGCTRLFSDKSALKKHTNYYHLKVTPYLCDKCPKAYKSWIQLKYHRVREHEPKDPNGVTPEREHLCPICGAAFYTNSLLKRHVDAHSGEQPWKCPFPGCPAKYIQKITMTLHYKKKHMTQEPQEHEPSSSSFVQSQSQDYPTPTELTFMDEDPLV